MVGTHASGTATIVIAIAEIIEIFARWRRRIWGTFRYERDVSSATRPAFPACCLIKITAWKHLGLSFRGDAKQ
jgi:hypothetical protein